MLYGTRSAKYPNTCCYGVIISARCDLANCKIPKFYFLTALKVEDWITTNEGFRTVFTQKINDLEKKLQDKARNSSLDWEILSTCTQDEFHKIIIDDEVGLRKEASKLEQEFVKFKKYTSEQLNDVEKKELLSSDKKLVADYLTKISGGQVAHYCFIPQDAYKNDGCKGNGIIIDLQELEQLTLEEAIIISSFEMDCKSKTMESLDIQILNKRFFLDEPNGFVIAECDITSPWIEYLMQRFANAFIRIGVDGPKKNDFAELFDRI